MEEIVIDGKITDENKVQTVYISRTKNINDISSNPTGISDAIVKITDDAGNTFDLSQTALGVYQTQSDVRGVTGRAYQLHVTLGEKEYRSEPEILMPSDDVVALNAQYKTSYLLPISNEIVDNVVVFDIDVQNSPGTTNFYKYDWDATYRIISPFKDSPDSCTTFTGTSVPPSCYTNEQSSSFLNILSLEGFSGAVYSKHNLTAVNPDIRFMSRFSMNVTQYGITERAFTYWNTIKAQAYGTGSLFDPPPAKVIGNIRSLSNPKENVLGYFMAASVKTKRGFFNADIVTSPFEHMLNCDCLPWRNDCEPPIPDWMKPPPPPKRIFCCDCSDYPNSTSVKPTFWID